MQRNNKQMTLSMLMFVAIGILALAIIFPAQAAVSDTVTYSVTLLKYEPTPAQPGDVVDAWVQITNTGGIGSKPVTVRIEPSYPFTPVSAADSKINLGSIASSSSLVTRVKLAVDSSVKDGTYTLPIKLTDDGTNFLQYDTSIQVRTTGAILSVVSAETTPAKVVPGNSADFEVVVRNTQSTVLRDVSLEMALTNTEFSPLGTTTKQTISRIEGGQSATYRFTLIADPEASSGVSRIPLTFSFTNQQGTTITQSETAGIVVHSSPELSVLVDQARLDATTGETIVLARIVNKGLSQVKFAEINLENAQGYTLSGNQGSVYVGNIDSDDFETAEFIVKPDGNEFTLQGTLTYRDALNEEYSSPIALQVSTPQKPAKGAGSWLWLIIIVVIVVGVVLVRRRKARNH